MHTPSLLRMRWPDLIFFYFLPNSDISPCCHFPAVASFFVLDRRGWTGNFLAKLCL